MQPDTLVPGAANPQAFNRYSYVLNNPLRYTDPTGHYCVGDDDDCADEGGYGPAPSGNGGGNNNNNNGGVDGDPHDDDDADPNPNHVVPPNCSIQTCIGQPNYWDLNPTHPDYYTLNGSLGFVSFSFIIDRYGHAYWSGGLSLNTTILTGPGLSFTGGHIGGSFLDSVGPLPNVNNISSFIAGVSGNFSVGAGPAGGLTFSPGSEVPNNFGTVSTIGVDAGVSSPFAGGSVMLTGQNQIPVVNQFTNWFIGKAKSILP